MSYRHNFLVYFIFLQVLKETARGRLKGNEIRDRGGLVKQVLRKLRIWKH